MDCTGSRYYNQDSCRPSCNISSRNNSTKTTTKCKHFIFSCSNFGPINDLFDYFISTSLILVYVDLLRRTRTIGHLEPTGSIHQIVVRQLDHAVAEESFEMVPKSANWMVNGHIAVIFLFAFDCGCCCGINSHSLIGSLLEDIGLPKNSKTTILRNMLMIKRRLLTTLRIYFARLLKKNPMGLQYRNIEEW